MASNHFQPFAVEQYLSENEHNVRFNFSESGVHPLSYSEFFELAQVDTENLFAELIDYPQVNGFESLREVIAARYPGATADNVLVTIGASEANTLVAATLLSDNDNIVKLSPTYEQLSGNATNLGFEVRNVPTLEDQDWRIDVEGVNAALDQNSRILHIVNPNNPTGKILTGAERTELVSAAAKHQSWLVADEVYIGTERDTDEETQSFWGAYDRTIVINSMSKAYGMPGLRMGWMVAPTDVIEACWRRHEYAAIAATRFSMRLAEHALREPAASQLKARARKLIRRGFGTLVEKLNVHPGIFSVVPPQASAMSFVKFDLPVSSDELALRLLQEQDVLVIPGSKFGWDKHFRFSSALPEDHLIEGLDRFNEVVGVILEGK